MSTDSISQTPRKSHHRRSYSCGPCKLHKTKCDQKLPCHSCQRYRREHQCRLDPPKPKGQPLQDVKKKRPLKIIISDPEMMKKKGSSISRTQPQQSENVIKNHEIQKQSNLEELNRLRSKITQLESLVGNLTGVDSTNHSLLQGPIHDVWNLESSKDVWRGILLRSLPSKKHCCIYIDYYFDYVDYIYHPLHNISFRKELDEFWEEKTPVDLTWLSIFFMIISLSSLHLPKHIANTVNVDEKVTTLSQLSERWFRASRQALQANDFDSKPQFAQLQTFSLSQLYLYATNQIELLNSLLAQAVRHAQVLGLHTDTPGKNAIETELRRRIWWDICGCDTFQSLCMGRPVLVNSYTSQVPFPVNSHEKDLVEDGVKIQPDGTPTIMSFQIQRNVVMKILNQLYLNVDGAPPTFQAVLKTEAELHEYIKTMPWFLCAADILPNTFEYIHFQTHILHTCLCMHRVRIHQTFLQPSNIISWNACLSSLRTMFVVYSQLRTHYTGVGANYLFIPQIHQSFSAAVAQALFMLVETPLPNDAQILLRDVDMFIADLDELVESFFVDIPILNEGRRALRNIREKINTRMPGTEESAKKIVSDVYSVFGGKMMTESYLKRCQIGFLVNNDDDQQNVHNSPQEYYSQNQEYYPSNESTSALYAASLFTPISDYTAKKAIEGFDFNTRVDLLNWDGFV